MALSSQHHRVTPLLSLLLLLLAGSASLHARTTAAAPLDPADPSDPHPNPNPTPTPAPAPAPFTTIPTTVDVSVTVTMDPRAAEIHFHRQEYNRLRARRNELTQLLLEAQAKMARLEGELLEAADAVERDHADALLLLPSPRERVRRLSCVGWKRTRHCRWQDERLPAQDKLCYAPIMGGTAGYCEVRDDDAQPDARGAVASYRVMRVDCWSLPHATPLFCQLAPQFANFPAEIDGALALLAPPLPTPTETDTARGLAMLVRAYQLPRVWASLRVLRDHHGCTLPIELWTFERDIQRHMHHLDALRHALTRSASGATAGGVYVRTIEYLTLTPSEHARAAAHAVVHSRFTEVLLLDADTLVLRDPTPLFTSDEFQRTGAVFWPDVFHPETTQSLQHASSLVWELLDLAFRPEFEQDARQLLVHRGRARQALRVLQLIHDMKPNLFRSFQLGGGVDGKDLFRLAWRRSNAPFHLVATPPALGGGTLPDAQERRFCGAHVIQHDPAGELLFLHRQPLAFLDVDVVTDPDLDPEDLPDQDDVDAGDNRDHARALTQLLRFDASGLSEPDVRAKFLIETVPLDVGGDEEDGKKRKLVRPSLTPHCYVRKTAARSSATMGRTVDIDVDVDVDVDVDEEAGNGGWGGQVDADGAPRSRFTLTEWTDRPEAEVVLVAKQFEAEAQKLLRTTHAATKDE